MAKPSQKKARHQQKRQQKRRLATRARSGSVYRRIGDSGELVACYVNANWSEEMLASIHILRRAPGGGHAMGAYLVDLGCIGLKDAWGRLDITYQDFQERVLNGMPAEIELIRVDLSVVQRLVAGGIRFAQENGFRLPPRYERWVALLGDIGDWHRADLSEFGVDGRLHYVGNLEDLERRLVNCTLDEFLGRDDVDYIAREGPSPLIDESEDAVEEAVEQMKARGLNAVRQWCFTNGIVPHPRLREAWDVTTAAMLQVDSDPDEEMNDEVADEAASNMERLLSFESPASHVQLRHAIDQVQGFMRQFKSADEMLEAIGLDDADVE